MKIPKARCRRQSERFSAESVFRKNVLELRIQLTLRLQSVKTTVLFFISASSRAQKEKKIFTVFPASYLTSELEFDSTSLS